MVREDLLAHRNDFEMSKMVREDLLAHRNEDYCSERSLVPTKRDRPFLVGLVFL